MSKVFLNGTKAGEHPPVLLLSGGSEGIGRAAAAYFAERGWKVYELSRRERPLAGVVHLSADVQKNAAVQAAVQSVLEQEGQIDLCICNAGFGISGSVEETAESDFLRQMDVNFHGAVRLAQAVLPAMRARGRGRIICVSSMAAIMPIAYQAFYSASKAALLTWARALDMEVRPFGVRVLTILPGDLATGFTKARQTGRGTAPAAASVSSPYSERYARSLARMEKDETSGQAPAWLAARLWRLAHRRSPRSACVPGLSYRFFAFLRRILPLRLIDFILRKLYA